MSAQTMQLAVWHVPAIVIITIVIPAPGRVEIETSLSTQTVRVTYTPWADTRQLSYERQLRRRIEEEFDRNMEDLR